jgi:spermidine synthase
MDSPLIAAVAPSSGSVRWTLPFLLGLNAQVAQLLVLRESLILSNGSETALGICLGAWALCNGAGVALAGGCERAGLDVGRFFKALLLVLPFLLIASLHVTRVSRVFTGFSGAEHLPVTTFLLLALLAVGPVSLLGGFLFVSGLRRLSGAAGSGRKAAFFYGLESSGSLVGGLVFSTILVVFCDPMSTAGLLVCLNLLLLLSGSGRPAWIIPVCVLCVGAAAILLGGWLNEISERERWSVLQPEMKLLRTREGPYQNLSVLSYRDQVTFFGNGGVLFSVRSRSSGEFGDWDRALFANFALLQCPAPENVLVVGGGCKGIVTDILLHDPGSVDWVEYDGELIELAREHLIAEERESLSDPRVHSHVNDGRRFLAASFPGSYDLVLLDLPDPVNACANRFYTREFFGQCRRVLREDGVLAFNISCQTNFIGEDILARNGSVLSALASVFPDFLITPGENSFVAASGGGATLTSSADELTARYGARGIETRRFDPSLFHTRFEENDVAWINRTFRQRLAEKEVRPNSDNRPVAYFRDYLIRRRITGDGGALGLFEKWLSGAHDREPPFLWIPLLFPLLGLLALCVALFLKPGGKPAGHATRVLLFVAAAATGFGGIVLEVTILLSYQAVAGHLYSRMGVIIACYMSGLTLGTLLAVEGRSKQRVFLFSAICAVAGTAACLTFPTLYACSFLRSGALSAFAFASVLVGAAGGFLFRGVVVALDREGRSPGGTVYFFDILGTCLGGLIAGSVLVPFLGISGTVLLAGGVMFVLPVFAIAAMSPAGAGFVNGTCQEK